MLLGWLIAVGILIVVASPFIASFYRRARRRRRQRLVSSPRTIPIAAEHKAGRTSCEEGGHERLRERVRPDGNNGYVSVCKRCGVRMHRTRGGEWAAVEE